MYPRYRIYFHNAANFPQVWSIDQGTLDTEIHVQSVILRDVTVISCSTATADKAKGEPSGWFELSAHLVISGSTATFSYPKR